MAKNLRTVTITLREDQVEWLKKSSFNTSLLLRRLLDDFIKEMSRFEAFKVKK